MSKQTDYFNYSDTSDLTDAQIEWVSDKMGFYASVEVARKKANWSAPAMATITLARFIRDFKPELMVDPLDAAIGEAFDRLPSTWTRETFVKSVGETLRECGMELEREKSQ